jgi:hypothetical protein
MTEDDFINAVAPKHEDYVSFAVLNSSALQCPMLVRTCG